MHDRSGVIKNTYEVLGTRSRQGHRAVIDKARSTTDDCTSGPLEKRGGEVETGSARPADEESAGKPDRPLACTGVKTGIGDGISAAGQIERSACSYGERPSVVAPLADNQIAGADID